MLLSNHRAFTRQIIEWESASQAYGAEARVAVGIDECSDSAAMQNAMSRLVRCGAVFMVFPLWQDLRRTRDGEIVSTCGIGSLAADVEYGERVPGFSWSDDRVVAKALANLITYRKVFIVSENSKGDVNGLRHILNISVRPELNACLDHKLSLQLLLRRATTRVDVFADRVSNYIASSSTPCGYSEQNL